MMSDTRLAMREFRFLDEKRKLTTLSSSEEQRWRELKQALGAPEPNVPARSQADGNAQPMPTAAVPSDYAPYTTPGYGQMPAVTSGLPPPALVPRPENSTLPAAELLGLSDSPSPPQRTIADTGPAATASLEPSSAPPDEVPAEDVMELDPSEVTLLDAEVQAPKPIARAPEPVPQSAAPLPTFVPQTTAPPTKQSPSPATPPAPAQPAIAAQAPDDGEMIDLSTAEAVDTGEFNLPEALPEPPASGLPPKPAAASAVPAPSAPAAFTQPPVALEEQKPAGGRSAVEGEHRVIIHTHEGQVKRGVIRNADVLAQTIAIEQSGQSEQVPTERIKAIFFMKPPGAGDPPATGQKIRVTLADGRQVLGFSTDFQSDGPGFFLVPADVRTNTSRIYLFRSAVDVINQE
jgi:hypothetical protein